MLLRPVFKLLENGGETRINFAELKKDDKFRLEPASETDKIDPTKIEIAECDAFDTNGVWGIKVQT